MVQQVEKFPIERQHWPVVERPHVPWPQSTQDYVGEHDRHLPPLRLVRHHDEKDLRNLKGRWADLFVQGTCRIRGCCFLRLERVAERHSGEHACCDFVHDHPNGRDVDLCVALVVARDSIVHIVGLGR